MLLIFFFIATIKKLLTYILFNKISSLCINNNLSQTNNNKNVSDCSLFCSLHHLRLNLVLTLQAKKMQIYDDTQIMYPLIQR